MRKRLGMTLIVVAAAIACGPSKDEIARRGAATDSAAAIASKQKAAEQAGEVMASRREAQTYLDSARVALRAKKNGAAANELRDAATFTRQQMDSATGSAKLALQKSAYELDELATRLTTGRLESAATLDHAFGRLQIAETQMHSAHALAAWRATKPGVAGAELIEATDHFERALKDAGRPSSDSTANLLKDTRALAAKLTQGATVSPAAVDATIDAFDRAVQALSKALSEMKS